MILFPWAGQKPPQLHLHVTSQIHRSGSDWFFFPFSSSYYLIVPLTLPPEFLIAVQLKAIQWMNTTSALTHTVLLSTLRNCAEKTLRVGYRSETTGWLPFSESPGLVSGLFRHKYQEWASDLVSSAALENLRKVLIAIYNHFSTFEKLTHKLFFYIWRTEAPQVLEEKVFLINEIASLQNHLLRYVKVYIICLYALKVGERNVFFHRACIRMVFKALLVPQVHNVCLVLLSLPDPEVPLYSDQPHLSHKPYMHHWRFPHQALLYSKSPSLLVQASSLGSRPLRLTTTHCRSALKINSRTFGSYYSLLTL